MTRSVLAFLCLSVTALLGCSGGSQQSSAAVTATAQAPTAPAAAAPPVAVASPTLAAAASPSPAPSRSDATGSAAPIASPAASPASVAGQSGLTRFAIAPGESQASYMAREKFADRPLPNDAVGTTKEVSGMIELDDLNRFSGRVVDMKVDLRTLASDQARRDNFIKNNFLESNTYPLAEFTSDSIVAAPDGYREGEDVTFKLPGRLKVHATERPVIWDVTARRQADTISGAATVAFNMSDFNVPPPKLPILSVEDNVKLEVKLVAKKS